MDLFAVLYHYIRLQLLYPDKLTICGDWADPSKMVALLLFTAHCVSFLTKFKTFCFTIHKIEFYELRQKNLEIFSNLILFSTKFLFTNFYKQNIGKMYFSLGKERSRSFSIMQYEWNKFTNYILNIYECTHRLHLHGS